MSADPLELALDYAWNWQDTQLKGRLQAINFFIVSTAFLVASYVTALTALDAGIPGVASGIAVVGGVGSSLAFQFIDKRFSDSMLIGEAALIKLEQKLKERIGIEDIELFSRLRETQPGGVLRHATRVIRVGYTIAAIAWLAAGGYALSRV